MADQAPWLKYQTDQPAWPGTETPTAGPWQNYAPPAQSETPPQQPSIVDQFLKMAGVPPGPARAIPGVIGNFAVGVGQSALDVANYGKDVMTGKVDPLSPEGIQRNINAAMWLSPVTPAAAWLRAARPAIPTSKELKTIGGAGFNQARNMNVQFDQGKVTQLFSGLQNYFLQKGLGPLVAKETNGILNAVKESIADPTKNEYTFDAAINNLQGIAQTAESGKDRMAASVAIDTIRGFIRNPPSGSVVAGPAAALGPVLDTANSNWAAGSRAQTLQRIAKRSVDRSSATNSGRNLDNAIRGRVENFIAQPIKGGPSAAEQSGLTKTEIDMLQKIVDGTVSVNRLRDWSNMLGGGGGLGASVAFGIGSAATGNPNLLLGVVPPAVGVIGKMAENSITKRRLATAAEELRKRSAEYQTRAATARLVPVNPAQRAATLKALFLGIPGAPAPQYTTDEYGRLVTTQGKPGA